MRIKTLPIKTVLIAGLLSMQALAAESPAGRLVLYTSQAPDIAQQTVSAFNQAYPNIKVEWSRNGTSQLMNILRTEMLAGGMKADVLLVADNINLGQLKKEGHLLPWAEAPVGQLDPRFYDPQKTWFGTKVIATVIARNTARATAVDSWQALTKPENRGQVAVPSPLYSGAALNHLHTLIHTPSLGWTFYQQLADNDIAPQGGNGPALQAVAGGLAKYGMIADADILRAKQQGSPVDISYPKEGVSFITEPVAILKDAHNLAAAKAFVRFVISRQGQELVARQGNRPIDSQVPAPEGFAPLSDIKLLPLDVDQALADDQAVRDRFVDIFGG
ncbi:ABC transporter substrate-binding protein [Biostraticola tofi]|uniref:Iron(III) transport system substrate-binding protein n=1 Tax=Biostraticola tofi TaxID=466109 RepID=A0A4R3Z587_9GAMM|nr:iron(III) transport system substrate-binding protein [Biostraticola tofi]